MNHTDVVEGIKSWLVARGVPLNSPCGAFEITKRVAWALRDEGAGLVAKASGNNCAGFKVDGIMYRDGTWFDCLINAETDNVPAWQSGEVKLDPSWWRAPFDPGDQATNPAPAPNPPPVESPIDAELFVELVENTATIITSLEALTAAVVKLNTNVEKVATSGVRLHI